MKKINWLKVGMTVVIILFFLAGGAVLMGDWSYRGWNLMGPGRMMADGDYTPLGWIRLIVTWLIPISLIVLALFGTYWLMQDAGKPKSVKA
jgi:hypothetical protein